MQSPDLIRELCAHMEWADSCIWSSLKKLPDVASDKALHERMYHIHFTQHSFLQVWLGNDFKFMKSDAFPDLSDVENLARSFYTSLSGYLEDIETKSLDAPTPLPWAIYMSRQLGRDVEVTTLGDTLFQITSHSVHHRGQVNLQIRDMGGEPPLIDYIVWVWLGRPSPEWPS